ncbi:transcriptional regulator [Saccharibacillus sp. O16]|nr:transcriptional regulator [Saccharibacillus sp. O16]
MKPLYHPERSDIRLVMVLHALSDPVRLGIVAQVARCGEQPCKNFDVALAKSTLSQHIRTLREAGITRTRALGTQRLISLRTEDLDERFPGLLDAILRSHDAEELTNYKSTES